MHSGNNYSLKEFLFWTRRDIFYLLVLSMTTTVFYQYFGWKWMAIPWVPIALVGTAAAFIVGFKNTQTYNRLWEARQIFGGIVSLSRSWGILMRAFIDNHEKPAIYQELVYRHLAWLTALRYQLREPRTWENMNKSYNIEYQKLYDVPERDGQLENQLKRYLSEEEFNYVWSKRNKATHILSLQSKQLKYFKEMGWIETLSYIELEKLLVNLLEQQGKCERIKNFPYPRQFASINLFFIRLFVFIVPFGLLQEFNKLGEHFVWLNIPFSLMVNWVFVSMEKVGESTENPFEGGANDVPISALSRTIEIELREMLGEENIPPPLVPRNNILM